MKTHVAFFLLLAGAAALFVVSTPADAGQRGAARSSTSRGGGGASANRASAQPRQASANRSAGANRSTGSQSSRSTSRSSSTSRSREVNVDREVSIDVDDGCCFNGDIDHPVAAGMAIAGTAAVIGSMVHSVPANCVPVAVNGLTYQQCGSTWYQPQMNGSSTTYVVVNPPN